MTHSVMGRYPSWADEIRSLVATATIFVVSGNVRDIYLDPESRTLELPDLLRQILAQIGFTQVGVVRAGGQPGEDVETLWSHATVTPQEVIPEAPVESLGALAGYLNHHESRALIVLDASRAVTDPTSLSDEEADMFRDIRRFGEDQNQVEGRDQLNPLIWVVDADHDVPPWFCGGNPRARSVSVPLPSASDRDIVAERILKHSQRDADAARVAEARHSMVDQTDSLPLRSITQILALARRSGNVLDTLDDAIRLFRVGVLDNPWKQTYVADRLRSELRGEGTLPGRIKGQDTAIDKALDVLVRSVTGLRSAHSSSGSTKPRGVLFFAGPTGVGKTELAKGLASLLFGDDAAMIRFDMSEFASSHAAERLVGAPPGYVGFAQGGELTNAVRQRPFSLLLFDEIEKADHSLLDRFLQILDDGRLTDGRGETTYFTESVIVFTSNLGIYETLTHAATGVVTGRRLAVDPAAGYEKLSESVTQKVRDHFTSVVGRPELLNRIGDNIVVFDFIRREVALDILDLMVRNVARTYRREYGSILELTEAARTVLVSECLGETTLMMGGRGIGNLLETVLIDPLARWTFSQVDVPGSVTVEGIRREGHRFSLDIRGERA